MRLISSICLIALTTSLWGQNNNFAIYSIEEGLAQSNVYSIVQDARGYLWMGTDAGVSRFDGNNFVTFNTKNALAGNVVRSMLEDSKGNLWFGTDEGITIYDGLKYTDITEDYGFGGSTVLSLIEDNDGNVWAGTDDGGVNRIRLKEDTIEVKNISTEFGLSSPFIFDIHEDDHGRIWLATYNGGLNILTNTNEDSVHVDASSTLLHLPTNTITDIEADADGDLWCATLDTGVFQIEFTSEGAANIRQYGFFTGAGAIWSITARSNGEIWIGTETMGVYRVYKEVEDHIEYTIYGEKEGLPPTIILAILEDDEGNMWLGSNGDGAIKFLGDVFAHYTVENGLGNNKVLNIQQDQLGGYWIATDGGGLTYMTIRDGHVDMSTLTVEDGLPSNFLNAVAIGNGENQNLWIATTKNGIVKYNGFEFFNYTRLDGLKNDRVYSIHVDRNGRVWCGTAEGISLFDGLKFRSVSMQAMLIEDDGVKAIVEGDDGIMWFGTAGALVEYAGEDSITTYDEVEGLYDKDVNALAIGRDGDIWIGTNGGGIYRFDVQREEELPISFVVGDDILSSGSVNSLYWQDATNLIVGTDKGFDRLTFNQEWEIIDYKNYDASDGFMGVECNDNALLVDESMFVWFGTVKGLTRYSPVLDQINLKPPKVHITDLKLFYKDVEWSEKGLKDEPWFNLPKETVLPYSDNHLTFYFTAISLKNSKKVRFQYMLEGRDFDWSPEGTDLKVSYSGLSPGSYVFKVKAKNADGMWSEATEFAFRIEPPWYQTTAFYIGAGVVLILLIWGFIKFRERRLKQEKMILEKKVEERTAEVVRQKEEIEAKNDEITDSINYASRIQEAILPLNDRMRELIPESFVLFKPKDIVSGDFYWMTNVERKVLFSAVDCTGHGVPGAFMSMIGTSLLNEVVNKEGHTEPAIILNEVREGIISSLKQRGAEGEQKDGMDMSLCALDINTGVLEFAGANNSLYIVRAEGTPLQGVDGTTYEPNITENGYSLFELKPNKMPVGYYTGGHVPFDNHLIQLINGDAVYSFTDGFADQFGGNNGKKFKYRPFKKLILSMQARSMKAQGNILDETIEEWRGSLEQIDDICVMGVKYGSEDKFS